MTFLNLGMIESTCYYTLWSQSLEENFVLLLLLLLQLNFWCIVYCTKWYGYLSSYILISKCPFLVTFFRNFLKLPSTDLIEIFSIVTTIKMEENCWKKYLKNWIEKFIGWKNYFLILCPSVHPCVLLFTHVAFCPTMCPSVQPYVLLFLYNFSFYRTTIP